MKIALFGGSFDPPHLGHTLVADQLVEHQIVDQVWFTPCQDHPFQKVLSAAKDRLAMLKLATTHKIYKYELNKPGTSFTIDTLEATQKKFPEHEFSWVIGSDQLLKFKNWREYQKILDNYQVFVYPRAGYKMTPMLTGMLPLSDLPEIEISSTKLRQQSANNLELELIHPRVKEYIQSKGLYK